MPLTTAFCFSLIASLLVWLGGRRDSTRASRVTAVSILLLLVFPLLSLLPKVALLPASPSPSVPAPETRILLQWLWLTGAALLTLRLILATLALERWRADSRLVERHRLGRRLVELRSLSSIQSPMAAGVLRPVVYVPEEWSAWPVHVQKMVLAHELSHHRRLDPLWRSLGAMACALHWFNPLVWWLVRCHAVQSEFACDAMVVRHGVPPRSYASLLCDLASSRTFPLSAVAMANHSTLGARVNRLLSPVGTISPTLSALLIASIVIAAVSVAVLRRADPKSSPIPTSEIRTRLSADPFPGNS